MMANNRFILIAEDDADDRSLINDALLELGLSAQQFLFCEDGEELMNYLYKEGKFKDQSILPLPDLMIIDINMPRKNGLEAISEIKVNENLAKIPIIILSTSKESDTINEAYELGVNSFIIKPETFEALKFALKSISKYWLKRQNVSLPNF
jgi:CheY-like chemotaxis protein